MNAFTNCLKCVISVQSCSTSVISSDAATEETEGVATSVILSARLARSSTPVLSLVQAKTIRTLGGRR